MRLLHAGNGDGDDRASAHAAESDRCRHRTSARSERLPLRHIPTLIRRTVRDLNGFLYDKVTGAEYNTIAINIAKRDASGRFVVAEALDVGGVTAWAGQHLLAGAGILAADEGTAR